MGDHGSTSNKNDHFQFIKQLKELETSEALSLRKTISKEEQQRSDFGIHEIGKLKYYGVSEYGDQKGRSHWHYLLFNVVDADNIRLAWSNAVYKEDNPTDYSDSKGRVDIDPDVNVNNIDYVLKYMVKFKTGNEYENKERELSFMSKGIGVSIADSEFCRHISQAQNNQVTNTRGLKIPLPRYYRKKFLTDEQRLKKNKHIASEMERQEISKDASYKQLGVSRYERELEAKEQRLKLLKQRQKRNYE